MSGHSRCERSFAFEASSYNYYKLCANVFINELTDCIRCLHIALNDIGETVRFVDPRDVSNSNHGGAGIAYPEYTGRVEVVRADAFDNLFEVKNCQIVVKMDIEGHESIALHGLKSLFSENKVLIQIEAFSENLSRVERIMLNSGFIYLGSLDDDHYFFNDAKIIENEDLFSELAGGGEKIRFARSSNHSKAEQYIPQTKEFLTDLPVVSQGAFGDYHSDAAYLTGWADFGEVEGHILAAFIEKEEFDRVYIINNNAAAYYALQSNPSTEVIRVSPRMPKSYEETRIISREELLEEVKSAECTSRSLFVLGSHTQFDFSSDLYFFYDRIIPNLAPGTYIYFHNIFSPNVTIRKEHPGFENSVDCVDSAALNLYLQHGNADVVFSGLSAINDDWCASKLSQKVEIYGATRQEISTFIVKTK